MRAAKGPDGKLDKDAAIVDGLLKDLFFAETSSKADSGKRPATPKKEPRLSGSGPKPILPQGPPAAQRPSGALRRPSAAVASVAQPSGNVRWSTWGRVSLGVLIAVGMLQWPYSHSCGFKLGLYLTAAAMVLVTAGWGSTFSWKNRMPVAHSVSQMLLLWGFVLMAGQVLPRVGYTQDLATWRCVATEVPDAPAIVPSVSQESEATVPAEELLPTVPDTGG